MVLLALLIGITACNQTPAPQTLNNAVAAEDHDASLPQNQAVEAKLGQRIAFAKFDSLPLEKALQQWSLAADVKLVVNWPALKTAGVLPKTPVALTLRNVTLSKALQKILKCLPATDYDNRLGTQIADGQLVITTNRDLKKISVSRRYDISDLLVGLSDQAEPATGREPSISPLAAREDQIRRYLTDNIDALSWDDNVDTISWQDGDGSTHCQLMIQQTPQTQQKIRVLLATLRGSTGG